MAEPGDDRVIQDCKHALLLLRSLKDLLLGPRFKDFFDHFDAYIENRTNREEFCTTMENLVGPLMTGDVFNTVTMMKSLKIQIMNLDVEGALENWRKKELNCMQRQIPQHDKQPQEPQSMLQALPIEQERGPILRQQQRPQQQLQQKSPQRLPVLLSIQYAIEAHQELGPRFPEFCDLLGRFKTDSIDVESLQAEMTQLLGEHSKVWSSLKMCFQEQWMRQNWQEWFSFFTYITEELDSLESDSSILCRLWEDFMAKSISVEKFRVRMERFLNGNIELWYQFQSYFLRLQFSRDKTQRQ